MTHRFSVTLKYHNSCSDEVTFYRATGEANVSTHLYCCDSAVVDTRSFVMRTYIIFPKKNILTFRGGEVRRVINQEEYNCDELTKQTNTKGTT